MASAEVDHAARWRSLDDNGTLYAGELEIRLGEGLVLATGRALTLSVREFELLVAMARRAGAIVTREELYRIVWERELRAGDRSVDVYVSKLRTKLEVGDARPPLHPHPPRLRLSLPAPAFTRCSHGQGSARLIRRDAVGTRQADASASS